MKIVKMIKEIYIKIKQYFCRHDIVKSDTIEASDYGNHKIVKAVYVCKKCGKKVIVY